MARGTDTALSESKSKDLTNPPNFKPTPAMLVWLDVAVEHAEASPSEIEKLCKEEKGTSITRQSWYLWLDKPGFEDWYYGEYAKRRRRWLPTLDAIGMREAKRGNFDFWQALNKKAGEDLSAKSDSKVQVNILNALRSEKDEFGI